MSARETIAGHYGGSGLIGRLERALAEDGVDLMRPSVEDLAPYDQFHGRGLEATEDIAARVAVAASEHLLDVGSGLGGPARYFAHRFGCRVIGIDLTEQFCDAARHLTRLLGLDGKVRFELGDALAMPFPDRSFDGAYSMNVSMNIADKRALYREIHRVLKPAAWLVLSEIAKGTGPELDYPTPWSSSAQTSFLSDPADTRRGLEDAGFEVVQLRSTTEQTLAFGARSREMVSRGEKPPHRAVHLIHGDAAARVMAANTSRGVAEGRIAPVEVFCRKRG